MPPGQIVSVRWPPPLVASIDVAAAQDTDGNRSEWLAGAARTQLAAGGVGDPGSLLAALAPVIAEYLETCSEEERALARDPLEQMAKAYSSRSTKKAR